jgi:outer membrane protein OmpU
MKKVLFATTAAAAMIIGGVASAQNVTSRGGDIQIQGDARLGLGYNISNATGAGNVLLGDFADDEVRALSRVRFGVNMSRTTDTGITIGAAIRADNATGGTGGIDGTAFISGAYGTLTFGDTASAHQQHSGAVGGDLARIGLYEFGLFHWQPYIGNRWRARADDFENRPTVRYDFDLLGFGVSASTNRHLDEVGVGASFGGDFGGATFRLGGGYLDGVDNNQWSAGLQAGFAGFDGRVVYTNITDGGVETIGASLTGTFAGLEATAIYSRVLSGGAHPGQWGSHQFNPAPGNLAGLDPLTGGDDAYGLGARYNLGAGADLRGGVMRHFEGTTVADFGVEMAF